MIEEQKERKPEIIPPDRLHLLFSKLKCLLVGANSVDVYSVCFRKPPPRQLKIQITLQGPQAHFYSLTPSKLFFNQRNFSQPQKISITLKDQVRAKLHQNTIAPPQPVDISHLLHCRDGDYDLKLVLMKLFYFTPKTSKIHAMGSDDRCELALESSRYRYSAAKFSKNIELQDFIEVNGKMQLSLVNSPEPLTMLENLDSDQAWRDVDMGELHCLGLTSKGRAFAWGLGMMGELGVDQKSIKLVQEAIQIKSYEKAKQNSAEWPLIKYTYNEMRPGQKPPSLFRPQFIPAAPAPVHISTLSQVVQIACGRYHSLFLLTGGAIYSCGCAANGRLGLGQEVRANQPRPVEISAPRIIGIGAGEDFSMAVTLQGKVLSTGSGRNGVHCEVGDRWELQEVKNLTDIVTISCGAGHVGAISKTGDLYMWGNADNGRLGSEVVVSQNLNSLECNIGGPTQTQLRILSTKPINITSPDCGWTMIACGGMHTLARTGNGKVLSWGYNAHGQLGLASSQFSTFSIPQQLQLFQQKTVISLSAGQRHSSAVTIEGLLYTWGNNARGQLGLVTKQGRTVNQKVAIPHVVPELLGSNVGKSVARGSKVLVLGADQTKEMQENKEVFSLWKSKLMEHERSLIMMVDSDYRAHKREQRTQMEMKRRENERKKIAMELKKKKEEAAKQKQHSKQPEMHHTLSQPLKRVPPRGPVKQGFERVQVFNDRTVHSFKKPSGRVTHVTMFPARSAPKLAKRPQPLPAQKYFAKTEKQLKQRMSELEAEFNPYVFMSSYKLKHGFPSIVIDGKKAIRVEREFSLFNARYVYPFEPTPNPFRLDKM